MKLSQHWLSEWLDVPLETDALVAELTAAGLEVDAVHPVAHAFSDDVVVAEIVDVLPHPQADRLRLCQVAYGEAEPIQVVCGAANAAKGLKTAFAPVGSRLPQAEGQVIAIKKARLRGVDSYGMLCSEYELGLAERSSGIMALPDDAPVGTPLRTYLNLDDVSIEIDLTPNRGDCLSLLGVAREVAALRRMPNKTHDVSPVAPTMDQCLGITVTAPDACPYYCGRVIDGVDATAPSPQWMRERLRRCGVRPISLLVDVTNYVMLELGQPMHAFDAACLKGDITVRYAEEGEALTLLDQTTIRCDASSCVIADDAGPLALAGVMGGEASAVSDTTTTLFLESAFFMPEAIANKARLYGVSSESAHRFERGVDPTLARVAIERATHLLCRYAGGEAGPVTESCSATHLPSRMEIILKAARIERVLGLAFSDEQVETDLTALGMHVARVDGGWHVIPPPARFDIKRDVDLIEELARLHGYEAIAPVPLHAPAQVTDLSEAVVSVFDLGERLIGCGYSEAMSYSFLDSKTAKALCPNMNPKQLENPLSSSLAVMRTSLLGGLLHALKYNQNRQQTRVRLFEVGTCFLTDQANTEEVTRIAGVAWGHIEPEHWGNKGRECDFYSVKADVEALLSTVDVTFKANTHPALHPGQSAEILSNDQSIGWLGALNPELYETLDVKGPVFCFELDCAFLQQRQLAHAQPVSRFPQIRRDLAVLVDQAVPVASLVDAVWQQGAPLLHDVRVFDVFAGEGIPEKQKSIAFGLILQDLSRTLTEEEVSMTIDRVMKGLEGQYRAILRE